MHGLKAVLFDMDGTIADNEDIHRQAFNIAFEAFGYPLNWSREAYQSLLGISGGKERIRHCLKMHPLIEGSHEALCQITDAIHLKKSAVYRQRLLADKITLRPGVRRLITELRNAGLRLAIATSSSRENVDTLLHHAFGPAGIDLFTTIVTSDSVEDKKPSPAVYYSALSELDVAPESCIAIEDTENGNLAALAAGINTIITTHPLTRDHDFTGAALVLDQLGEPDSPFEVLAGNHHHHHYVDLKLLRTIHGIAGPHKPAVGYVNAGEVAAR